ncbi:hypothetical protein FALCPG4_017287 [Fusarium falciforme]
MKLGSSLQSLLLAATLGFTKAEKAVAGTDFSPCPSACDGTGPSDWAVYGSLESLSRCEKPMLFDFAVMNPLDDPETTTKFRACTSDEKTTSRLARRAEAELPHDGDSLKGARGAWWSSEIRAAGKEQHVVAGIEHIEEQLHRDEKARKDTIFFSYFKGTVIGFYLGGLVDKTNAVSSLLEEISQRPQATDASRGVIQVCGGNLTADYTVGVAISTENDLIFIQKTIKSWVEAKCVTTGDASDEENLDHLKIKLTPVKETRSLLSRHAHSHGHSRSHLHSHHNALMSRATCTTRKVISGDSCGSLATKCGISGADFTKYNSYDKELCSKLVEGQVVCCSSGSLPDLRPKPKADGECFSYTTQKDDSCSKIAAANGLKATDLDGFNKETWGWNGCKNLLIGQTICLSKGTPPLPAPVSNAQCGPTKKGTKKPSGDKKLADLNPCPLNVCCNIWGQCGTTKDYCTKSKSETGNPGTAKPGENGCVSNCGMDIVNNGKAPSEYKKIAYFESWNQDRPCLHMDVRTITSAFTSGWTHVHFAFANITKDYKVNVEDTYGQFKNFKGLKGVKRIVAFGGWSFSVGIPTYAILREAVKPAKREAFSTEIVNFVNNNKLDGVDFDWEYPGAPDLPDIPAGGEKEPDDYLEFLKLVRKKLGKEKSLSIAAPASFWYLKQFPIGEISKIVDYIVYMTYDLHGQWDFESSWGAEGCPKGSCLRSHVNMTETMNSLAMITKAGVEARQVVVGVSSYGRSFQMSNANCKGPMCTFTGNGAKKGKCTDTSGYISNAEIETIKAEKNVNSWWDQTTDTDYMIYDNTEWVAYMTETTKKRRISKYKGLNFGGTSDWAIDLQQFWADTENIDDTRSNFTEGTDGTYEWCDKEYDSVEDIPDSSPGKCIPSYILGGLKKELATAITDYKEVSKGYDDKFKWYVDWVKDGIDPALDKFMQIIAGEGNKYMDCEWSSQFNEGSGSCTKVYLKVPPGMGGGLRVIKYKMVDEDGFYKALLEHTGIEKDWIEWRDYSQPDPCPCATGPLKARDAKEEVKAEAKAAAFCPCLNDATMFKNYPRRRRDTGKINVPNPKEMIDEAIPKTDELAKLLDDTYSKSKDRSLDASGDDAATAFSMPVFMLEDAIESIKTVKEIGEKQKETKTKELVMNILTIVFAVIPFVGQAASALGGAAVIARAALIVGEAGNAALSIVEIVDDPLSAPFAILGMLIGAGGIKTKGPRKAFNDAAEARRALDAGKLKLFSPAFRRKDEAVQNLLKKQTCKIG